MKVSGDPWKVLRHVEPQLWVMVDQIEGGWYVELHPVNLEPKIPEATGEGRTVETALRRALEDVDLELLRLHV
jgi:hypothetical protein